MAETKTVAIIGVGTGLGSSLAARFAREGYRVAVVARQADERVADLARAGGGQVISGARHHARPGDDIRHACRRAYVSLGREQRTDTALTLASGSQASGAQTRH